MTATVFTGTASSATAPPEQPFGPPSLENVRLTDTGDVECHACEVTPAVSEIAILLQSMLATSAFVPSALRYAIARALHDVATDPRYLACNLETRSEIVVPILRGERYLAQIDVDSDALAAFGPRDRAFLAEVARVLEPLFP